MKSFLTRLGWNSSSTETTPLLGQTSNASGSRPTSFLSFAKGGGLKKRTQEVSFATIPPNRRLHIKINGEAKEYIDNPTSHWVAHTYEPNSNFTFSITEIDQKK